MLRTHPKVNSAEGRDVIVAELQFENRPTFEYLPERREDDLGSGLTRPGSRNGWHASERSTIPAASIQL